MSPATHEIDLIPLHLISLDAINARNGAASIAGDQLTDLTRSMGEIGQLYPIVVRRDPEGDGYRVAIGKRRFCAALALGWDVIKAMTWDGEDAALEAMSAAENMAREAMSPVDEWLAVQRLTELRGWSVPTAAAALGIDPVRVPRMAYLARMSPRMLDAMRANLPERLGEIRVIAAATHEQQDAALDAIEPPFEWWRVAKALTVTRVSRAAALFDPAALAWDEDLFAEPDAPERFTTTNVQQFIECQRVVLLDEAKDPKKHIERVVELSGYQQIDQAAPKHMRLSWDMSIPKRWRKDDPRRVLVALYVDGPRMGSVERRLLEPKSNAAPAEAARIADAAPEPKPPISKAAQRLIAQRKRDGVLRALAERNLAATGLLRVLLLALASDNVICGGFKSRQALVAAMVDAEGKPAEGVSLDAMRAVVRQIVGDVTIFRAPDVFTSSGAAAEWVALALEAEMPRCDTADILKGVSLAALQRLAREADIADAGTATQLRARLVGQLPEWRPEDYGPMRHHLAGIATGADDADDADDDAQPVAEAAE